MFTEKSQLIFVIIGIAILAYLVYLNSKRNQKKLYHRQERNFRKNYYQKKNNKL